MNSTIILGGGLAGLSAGLALTRAGLSVSVLERDPTVGGLAKTVVRGAFRFDLGGHRFYTKDERVEAFVRDLMGRDASVHGMLLWNITPEDAASAHAAIAAGMENGTLRPVVGLELPLAEAPKAHRKVMEPGAFGKIVLVP